MDKPQHAMTLKEVAQYLDVHRSTIYKYAQKGLIPAFKIGSDWRFMKEHIDLWIRSKDTIEETGINGLNGNSAPETKPSQTQKKQSQDIAVIGIACHYPGADNFKTLWENILARRVQFRRILDQRLPLNEYFDEDPKVPDKSYASKVALLDKFEFDWAKWRIPKRTFESADIVHWLALDTAVKAFADAGYKPKEIPSQNTGVVLGNTLTGEQTRSQVLRLRWPYVEKVLKTTLANTALSQNDKEQLARRMEELYKSAFFPITEDSLAGALANTIAGRICNYLNFKGGGYIVDGACSSSLLAVATAANSLKNGELDLVLAGGVDISLDPFELVGFSKAGALAKDQMRVYDKRASGFIPGEGCGLIVLKRLEDAVRDRNYVYAVIKGWGISSDGRGGIMEPSATGQAFAIKRAYKGIDYQVMDCDFIEGHGTGTTKGDRVELEGIASAVKNSAKGNDLEKICGVTSFKSIVGHTKAAAGIGGLIKAIMAVNQRVLPPTANCREPNEIFETVAKSLYPIIHGAVYPKDKVMRGGVSAAGFGGINCHIALESGDQPSEKIKPSMPEDTLFANSQETEVFVFASRTFVRVAKLIRKFKEDLRNISMAEMADLAARLNKSVKPHAAIKIAVVADSPENLYQALCLVEEEVKNNPPREGELHRVKHNNLKIHVVISNSCKENRIAFLYPGQGSQRVNMTRMLVERYSWARDLLKLTTNPLDKYIFEHGDRLRGNGNNDALKKKLSETQITQPAITFSSLAWTEFLSRLGVEPRSVAGHSLGELTAFYKGGAFNQETLLKFAEFRGEVMSRSTELSGRMVSLFCSHARAQKLVDRVKGEVVIANINSPTQVVVSGGEAQVKNIVTMAQKENITAYPLPVSNAFHSSLMKDASQQIKNNRALPGEYVTNGVGIYSCIDGHRIKDRVDLKSYFSKQMLSPVQFVQAVKSMSKSCDLFIEVGPGRVLSDLVKEINKNDGPQCLPIEETPQKDRSLNIVLAELFVRNIKIKWEELYTNRLIRPFIPVSRRKFLMNQCERPLKGTIKPDRLIGYPDAGPTFIPPKNDVSDAVFNAPVSAGQPVLNGNNGVDEVLIDLVCEATGYSKDTITFDLRLLDDLNMDSIKAAELIAGAAQRLGLAGEIDPSQYANSTLGEVKDELKKLRKVIKADAQPVPAEGKESSGVQGKAAWTRNFVTVYTEEGVREKDLTALNKINNAFIISENSGQALSARIKEHFVKINPRANVHILEFHEFNEETIDAARESDCLIFISPVNQEEARFKESTFEQIIQRFHQITAAAQQGDANQEKVVAFVQFGGGYFGENGQEADIAASCCKSFAATLHLERPQLKVRVIDFDREAQAVNITRKVMDELQTPQKFLAAGYDKKFTRRVPVYQNIEAGLFKKRNIKWSKKDIILVTGGAKGITAECALEFAQKYKAQMILIGRSEAPAKNDDETNEIARTLSRFKKKKLKCRYFSCDVTDYEAVEELINKVGKQFGRITGIIHGAGLITIKRLEQLTAEQACRDALPKVIGAVNICEALKKHPLKLIAGLTSVIGVTGMVGSGWYGVANEVLNLYLNNVRKKKKGTTVVTIAYSIWDEVGMGVRTGSVNRLSFQGINAIPREEGVKRFRQVLEHDCGKQQVIVAARMSGIDTWRAPELVERKDLRFIEDVRYILPGVELITRVHLNVIDDPYLLDHDWKGSLLFPMVFGLEAMAQAAACLTNTRKFKGLKFKDINLAWPIPVNRETGADIEIRVEVMERESRKEGRKVKVEIFSAQTNFSQPHFSAVMELDVIPKVKKQDSLKNKKAIDLDLEEDVYGRILFQGKMFRCIKQIYKLFYNEKKGKGECVFEAEYNKSALPFLKQNKKFKSPFMIGDPFFIDSILQSMQLIVAQDACLPNFVGEVEIAALVTGCKIKTTAKSAIHKISKDTYTAEAHSYVLNITDCQLKVLEHLKKNPTANDLVSPARRDEEAIRKELKKIKEDLNIELPIVKCLYDPNLRNASKDARHKIELPLIRRAIAELLGENKKRRAQDIHVDWLKSGKPIIVNDELDHIQISLSHCGRLLICAVGYEEQGCDVEVIKQRSKKEWRMLLGREKYQVYEELINNNFDNDFSGTGVWSACEAIFKLIGLKNKQLEVYGIRENRIYFIMSDGSSKQMAVVFRLSNGNNKIILAIATKVDGSVRQIKFPAYPNKENNLLKEVGYKEEAFSLKLDYSGPQDQLVFIKNYPITFKTNKLLSRGVYFTSYFDWMGEVREQSANPIMEQLAGKFESGSWGIATRFTKLKILGELRASDILETHFWAEEVTGGKKGTFDLCIDWRKIASGRSKERIAFSVQRITWVKVLSRGVVKVDELPVFIEQYMDTMRPRVKEKKPLKPLPEKYKCFTKGEKILSFENNIENKLLLSERTVETTLEHSNLIGNIYFSNYAKWLGMVRDAYLYKIIPEYYRGVGGKGELICVNCEINNLREAMPFDTILVRMYLDALYTNGLDFIFNYFLVSNGRVIKKIASSRHETVWVKRNVGSQVCAERLPKKVIDTILRARRK